MSKLILLIASAMVFASVSAQENEQKEDQGSYFSVSGSLGSNGLNYQLKPPGSQSSSRTSGLGYGLHVGYSYLFDAHWGVNTGIGVSQYNAKGKLRGEIKQNEFYNLGNQVDDDAISGTPRNYELRARISNLEEKQTAFFVEVPIMGTYQTRFGDSKRWGMYSGLGVKLQFPVNAKFSIQNGANSQLNVSGYYKDILIEFGAPDPTLPPISQHGFGTVGNPNQQLGWDDKAELKMGIAGSAELGLLMDLGNDIDLMLGGYLDYGFTDLKKNGSQGVLTAPKEYLGGANNTIGKGLKYNGMLNSNLTDKVNAISFGLKAALRFKL